MPRSICLKGKTAGCALALLLWGSSASSQELPLDEAVEIALHHNVDIANTALDVSKAKDRKAAFHTQLFP